MAEKKFVSPERLNTYHEQLKADMESADNATLNSAKEFTTKELDDFSTEVNSAIDILTGAIDDLEAKDTTIEGNITTIQSSIATLDDKVDDHVSDNAVHFTGAERTKLSGIEDSANNYTHPNSGVTAGTYKSVIVDAQGHITGGSNPTTLAGYGITDAEEKGTVSTHNVATDSHSDIRQLITALTTKVNNFLDVTDETTDQLSELIALITANKTDIETITNGKVNVLDIVDNLTTNVANKPLSAAQGVVLKTLVDNLESDKVDKVDGKGLSTNDFTDSLLTKLNDIQEKAEVNQNAFSNIAIGTTTISADSKTDTLSFSGSNISIRGDSTNDTITFSVQDGSTNNKGVVKLEDSTSSTSITTAATPNSVKSAYDLADTAKTTADTAKTKAESAYDLANTAKTTAEGKADEDHTHTEYIATEKMGSANGVATLGVDGKVLSAQLPSSNAGGLSYRIDNVAFAVANWSFDSGLNKYKYVYSNANITETTVVNVMFTLTSLSYANKAGVQQEVIEGNGSITIYANAVPSADLVADVLIYGAITSEELTEDVQTAFSNQITSFSERLVVLEAKTNTTRNYWSLADVNNTLTTSSTMEDIFNAMDIKSNLICTISSGSTSVYPSASGILEIHKINANYGTATFHYDGKTASGTFTA